MAMKEQAVGDAELWKVYTAVHFFGSPAWKHNLHEREQGLTRYVPPGGAVRRPRGSETWEAYRAFLFASGVRPKTACARGPRALQVSVKGLAMKARVTA